jgi:hypothetical protein
MAKPEPLIFPKGVRFARKNELPRGNEEAIDRIATANITTGFVRHDEENKSFTSYFEANIHANNVFAVFRDLVTSLLPEAAAPIIGLKDEEPIFGPYSERDLALKAFEPHVHELQNDGFLEFGMLFGYQGKIEEVFVKSSKHIQVWTSQPELVEQVFEQNNIPLIPDLQFIDQYPMVSKSVGKSGNAAWPLVLEVIQEAFSTLPEVRPSTE